MKNQLPKNFLPFSLLVLVFIGVPNISFAFTGILWDLVSGVFGMFTAIGGYLLNFAVGNLVVGFGDFYTPFGDAVRVTWSTVRDVFNLTFIFGLVYLGFKMILGSDDSGSRRWLVHIILAALLVNFSLFITQFIVDVSNILASEIVTEAFESTDISNLWMNEWGLNEMWGSGVQGQDTAGELGFIFGAMIFFVVAGFVFAAGAFLLIVRFAMLLLYMMLSPFMFLGWVFPGLQHLSSSYWRNFLKRAFFAPAYMLLLYMSFEVLTGYFSTLGNPDFSGISSGTSVDKGVSFANTFPPFILSVILMFASLFIAQQMGAEGANGAMRFARRGSQLALTRTGLGQSARAISYTGGKYTKRYIDRAQTSNNRFVRGFHRWSPVSDTLNSASSAMKNAKMGTSRTLTDARAHQQGINREADDRKKRREAYDDYNTANTKAEANRRWGMENVAKQADKQRQDAANVLAAKVPKMSDEELLATPAKVLASPEFARNLTDAQMKTLEKSGVVNTKTFAGVRDNRGIGTFAEAIAGLENMSATTDDLAKHMNDLGKVIGSLSNERKQSLADAQLSDPRIAMHLTEKDLENFQAAGFDSAKLDSIRKAKEDGLMAIASGNYSALKLKVDPATITNEFKDKQRAALMSQNTAVAGQLPVKVFTTKEMAPFITPQALEQRMRNGEVTNKDIEDIEKHANEYIANKDNRVGDYYKVENRERYANRMKKWSSNSLSGGSIKINSVPGTKAKTETTTTDNPQTSVPEGPKLTWAQMSMSPLKTAIHKNNR